MSNIVIAREFRRVSAIELASAVKVSKQQMSNWETGLRTPSRTNAEALADVLDVDVAWIMDCPQTMALWDGNARKAYPGEIMRSEAIEGYGTLYHVYLTCFDFDELVAVLVSLDGVVFTTIDWQTWDQPANASEIANYRWMDTRLQEAVMLDGLPRILA